MGFYYVICYDCIAAMHINYLICIAALHINYLISPPILHELVIMRMRSVLQLY